MPVNERCMDFFRSPPSLGFWDNCIRALLGILAVGVMLVMAVYFSIVLVKEKLSWKKV